MLYKGDIIKKLILFGIVGNCNIKVNDEIKFIEYSNLSKVIS